MDFDRMDGQVVAISGAGGGIGKEIALDLARRGARLVINDYGTSLDGRSGGQSGPAAEVACEITQSDGQAVPVTADIGSKAGAREVIDAALQSFGRIDGIVHAACVFPEQCSFEDMARADFERVLQVTVGGAWGMAQAAWPHFKAQRSGRVVLIQSAAGFYGRIGMPAYSIAKSSMIGYTSYLRQEGAPHGILVNNLSPVGWSRAAASEDNLGYMEQMFPASDLGPIAALLLHPRFDRSGLMLHSGGGAVTRMFIPETRGVVFDRTAFTPSQIYAQLSEVLDEADYRTPQSTGEVGEALFNAVRQRDGA